MITFLSGLPRTGSTLLCAILSQNPDIHAEGNSAVCQLMWDAQQSCERSEELAAHWRQDRQDDLVRAIPAIYYKDVNAAHIVDKCRSWALPDNMAMIRRYITDDPKVIVMTRPLDEIVASFVRLREANGWVDADAGLLDPMSEPIMRSQFGVEYARATNSGEFHFIEYADLVADPSGVLSSLYDFMGWESFAHDFYNVVNTHPEDDFAYGLLGLHDVRPRIGAR